jgi:hypothetical protein
MPKMHDWVPAAEHKFGEVLNEWKGTVSLKENQDAYGLPPEACTKLVKSADAYFLSLEKYHNIPTPANRHQKDDDKTTARDSMRSFARRYVRNNPKIPHNVLIQLNLEAPDEEKRQPVEVQDAGPNSRVYIDNRIPGFVKVRYAGARPHGAIGCEIMWQISPDAPVDAASFVNAQTDVFTANPWQKTFTGLKPGDEIHYVLRWIYRGSEYSSWSRIQSSVIPR